MAKRNKYKGFFEDLEPWKKEWQDMPEFIQENQEPYQQIIVSFKNKEDLNKFSKLIEQKITCKTQSIWFPKVKIRRYSNKRYIDES